MKVIVIKGQVEDDQTVYKDGEAVSDVDFSGVKSDIWAVQWDSETKTGEIEWASNTVPNKSVTSESEIDEALGVPLQTMITRRQSVIDAAKAKADADAAAAAAAEKEEKENQCQDSTCIVDPPLWMQNRLKEYPHAEELIVAIYDGDKEEIEKKRAAVKAKWPKDDSGPIEP